MYAPAYFFWDHDCVVCRCVASMAIWDSRRARRPESRVAADTLIATGSGVAIGALPFSDPRFEAWQADVSDEERRSSVRVVEVSWNDKTSQWEPVASFGGGRAAIEILLRLPSTRWLGRTIDRSKRLTNLTHRAYWLVARHRSRFAPVLPDLSPESLELDPPASLG